MQIVAPACISDVIFVEEEAMLGAHAALPLPTRTLAGAWSCNGEGVKLPSEMDIDISRSADWCALAGRMRACPHGTPSRCMRPSRRVRHLRRRGHDIGASHFHTSRSTLHTTHTRSRVRVAGVAARMAWMNDRLTQRGPGPEHTSTSVHPRHCWTPITVSHPASRLRTWHRGRIADHLMPL